MEGDNPRAGRKPERQCRVPERTPALESETSFQTVTPSFLVMK